MKLKNRFAGFTLIELLLVMVIVSIIIYASVGYMQQRAVQLRVDRTSGQMQQIMNAAMSYYITKGTWPTNLTTLQNEGFLSSAPLTNPWGGSYQGIAHTTNSKTPPNYYVWTDIPGRFGPAQSISATLPFGYTTTNTGTPPIGAACTTASTSCKVVGFVNIPGQNLNNATAVNFAGIYKHGGCVPVPQCPVGVNGDPLVPQIMVVPVSVSGLYDDNSTKVYPISSFTAYSRANLDSRGVPNDVSPPYCRNSDWVASSNQLNCRLTQNVGALANAYWRVCLDVVSEKGPVSRSGRDKGNSTWGKYVSLMAITRCAIPDAPGGSTFNVFSN